MIALINCFLINHQVRKWNEFYVALLLETLAATPLCVSWSWIRPGSFQGNLKGPALFKLTFCSAPKAPLCWNTTSFSPGPVLAKSTFSLQVYHSEFPSGIFFILFIWCFLQFTIIILGQQHWPRWVNVHFYLFCLPRCIQVYCSYFSTILSKGQVTARSVSMQ